jgi:hypothetical protein
MLLRSIVQVPLDVAACRIGARDDAGAGGDKLRAALGLRDRAAGELQELADTTVCSRDWVVVTTGSG